jgi:PAS domain S-box-containing protein
MKNELKPRQFFLELALAAGLAAAYFIAAKFGLRLAFVNASATAVWPPTGIALAAFLLLGRRATPGIWLGAFLANVTTAGSVGTSLAIATGNTLEGLIGGELVTRFAHGREVFERPADIFKFVVLAALGSTMVSATIGVTSLALAGFARWAAYGSIWLTWWLGDAVGAIVVTPVLVLWVLNPRVHWSYRRAFEFSLLLLALVLAGLFIFSGWSVLGMRNYPLQFICIPLFVWAAFRFSQREVAGLMLIFSGIALWGTLNGFGPFVEDSPNEALLLLQGFMGIVTVTTLVLAAVVAERNRLFAEARAANVELVGYIRERTVQLEVANRELHQEINEHRRTEAVRQENEQLLRLLMEGVRDYAIFLLDPQGHVISWNAGARRLKGYVAEEVIGQSLSIFYTPEDIAAGKPQQLLAQAVNEGRVEDEGWRVRKDGTRFWADAIITALRDSQERLRGFAKITRDVTERRRAEDALHKQTRLYETLLKAQSDLGDGLIITEGAQIVYANEALSKIYGYSTEELLALPSFLEVVAPEERGPLSERLAQRLGGTSLSDRGETVVIHKDGHRVYIEYAVKLIQVDGKRELFSIIRDITQRKLVEQALRRQEEEFRTLTENSPDIISRFDRQFRRLYVNLTIEEKTGIPWQSFIDRTNREAGIAEDLAQAGEARLRRVFETGEILTFESDFPTTRGLIHFETRLIPERGPEGAIETILAVTRDITERKQAEEALRRQEQEFRSLSENSLDVIDRVDRHLRHLYINPIVEEKTGIPWQAFIGKTNRELGLPEDRAELFDVPLRQVFQTGQFLTVEFSFTTPKGLGHFEARLIPERGPDGSIETVLAVTRDITDRKRSEAALQQANTRLMDTVAELEAFSYSVSHDLRAPLRVMQGFATTLIEDYGDRLDDPGRDFARRIVEAAQHMDRLIRDLLAYSRLNQTELNLEPVALSAVVAEAIADLQAEIEEQQAQVTVVEPLPRVLGHSGILVQIIQNLISNAVKFVPPQTQPQVHIWAEENPFGIRLWVKDNGLGIAAEYHERIFRIFERLHSSESYPGTGVGLALVHKGIERLGGRVGVESKIGQGSRFWLELPRVEEE